MLIMALPKAPPSCRLGIQSAGTGRHCWNISELSVSSYQLKILVELIGACNLIWYQNQGSRVLILVSKLNKIIVARSYIPCQRSKKEARREGECWNII